MDFSMKHTLKTLILTIALLVGSVSVSHAEWTEVVKIEGDTYFVDFDRIRKQDDFVYFWRLVNYLKPVETGTKSAIKYHQADCKLFRVKDLSFTVYKEPMGRGKGEDDEYFSENWKYPKPYTVRELILKTVCSL